MRSKLFALSAAVAATMVGARLGSAQQQTLDFRPPAVPLVTHDPYLSIWSEADKLTDKPTKHWTNDPNRDNEAMRLTGLMRVDGQAFRVIGDAPDSAQPLPQTSVRVYPTRSVYTFANEKIKLTLTFLSPMLPEDITLLSTPISYVIWDVTSADGQPHDVTAFFGAAGDLARHERNQPLKVIPASGGDVPIVKVGTTSQPVLARAGDATRIDWGYACLGGNGEGVKVGTGTVRGLLQSFAEKGELSTDQASGADDNATPGLGATINFGKVQGNAPVSRHVLVGYDDDKSIEWMGEALNGYWKKDGTTIEQAFARFEKEMPSIKQRCEQFDQQLWDALVQRGGEKYAIIASLSHRQSLAGAKVVADRNGAPLMFSKENTSNGCIGTVDVFFPQIPHLLLLNNDLAKATAVPILKYASSPRWKFPFAPHDVGTYPKANGQVYGDGERGEGGQMPVEECGNMLLIVGAICKVDGNADFAKPYWPTLTKWAKYLEEHGVDPANQLCTDDFAGHIARNANLSVKAITGMAAYGQMAEMLGQKDVAKHYHDFAVESAKKWMKLDDAGDHYGLVFEKPNTWSQKYNLVWDDILNLEVFPKEVVEKELAFYKTKFNEYGLPLDSREKYTKTDWTMWTGTLADDRATFDQYTDAVFKFADETDHRRPFSDWYFTDSAKVRGFIARPVIGGVFMPLLKDEQVWHSWAKKAKPLANVEWANLPVPPKITPVVATSMNEAQVWKYTFDKPADGWEKADFDDKGWKQGPGGFGSRGTPGGTIRTEWRTDDIWLRRSFNVPANAQNGKGDLALYVHHDEDVEIYLDGEEFAKAGGFVAQYAPIRLSADQAAKLTPGKHTFAVHCRQDTGGQYIDVGIVRIEPQPQPK